MPNCKVYILEATIAKSGPRIYLHLPAREQRRIQHLHGKKVRLLLVVEEDTGEPQ